MPMHGESTSISWHICQAFQKLLSFYVHDDLSWVQVWWGGHFSTHTPNPTTLNYVYHEYLTKYSKSIKINEFRTVAWLLLNFNMMTRKYYHLGLYDFNSGLNPWEKLFPESQVEFMGQPC